MHAALVGRERMNLVDNHAARRFQHGAAGFRTEQYVERFRRGHQNVRRAPAHGITRRLRRIAGTHHGADDDFRVPLCLEFLADAFQRPLEVALDIVG